MADDLFPLDMHDGPVCEEEEEEEVSCEQEQVSNTKPIPPAIRVREKICYEIQHPSQIATVLLTGSLPQVLFLSGFVS